MCTNEAPRLLSGHKWRREEGNRRFNTCVPVLSRAYLLLHAGLCRGSCSSSSSSRRLRCRAQVSCACARGQKRERARSRVVILTRGKWAWSRGTERRCALTRCCIVKQKEDDKPGLLPRRVGSGDCQGRPDGVSVVFIDGRNKRKIRSTMVIFR